MQPKFCDFTRYAAAKHAPMEVVSFAGGISARHGNSGRRVHNGQQTRVGLLPSRSLRNEEAGSALIEFAFSLMVLLMLTFGMMDLGFALYAANAVQSAAQAGARAAIVDQAATVATVHGRLGALNLANVQVSVVLMEQERIDVEVRYHYELMTPFLSQLGENGEITLTGQASMLLY